MIPVEGNKGLYRDEQTGAILNCSSIEYNSYMRSKSFKLNEIERIENLQKKTDDIEGLKSDVEELKDMMKLIISKLNSDS